MNRFAALIFLVVGVWSRSVVRGNFNINVAHLLPEAHGQKFHYFGFGSNMLAKRIHIQNPTAEFVGAALLEDYRLDFALLTRRWMGASATIVPTPGSRTWGSLWEIDLINLPDIDKQEGVHRNFYIPITVQIKLSGNETQIPARAYALTQQPETNLHDMKLEEVPEDRQPSKTYLQVLVKGAIESGLPEEYVQSLRRIKHNNKTVKELEQKLEVQDVELLNG